MRFRRALIYSIAGAAAMLVSPAPSLVLDMPVSALAATNVSVSVNTFYTDLAPYGSWVSYQNSYVFIPARLAADWRPYTVGHWVHTRRYGWLWASDEPFGWATYHYGRWGYAEDIGWYWIPGKRWAPAWVSWRRSGDHVVWAPLPPGRGGDVSIEIRVSDIPDYYWVAVPSRDFLDADLTTVVIRDETERVRVVEAAKPIGSVSIRNNIVVNNAIDVDYVQKTTDKKVETVNVKETDDPKQAGKGANGEVAVFNSEVKEDKAAKPPQVKDVDAVKKERAESGGAQPSTTQGQGTTQPQGTTTTEGQEQPTKKQKSTTSEQPTQPEQGQAEQEQPTKKKKSTTSEQPTQPEQGQAEQEQPTKKKKSTTSEQPTQPGQGQAEQEQPTKKKKSTTSEQPSQPGQGQAEQEQPTKKKKSTTSEQPTQPEQGQAEQGQEQTTTKKKYKASGQPTQQEQAQPEQGQEQPTKKKKSNSSEQPSQECDQATGEGC